MNGKPLADLRSGGAPILRGLIIALILAFVAILVISALTAWTDLPERRLPVLMYLVHMFASLTGAFVAARQAGHKGWYYGGLTALAYALSITLASMLLSAVSFSLYHFFHIALMGFVGAFGGVIGVNIESKK